MSIATQLFAKINGANGTAASDFASPSVPFDPATYSPSVHVVNELGFGSIDKPQVTIFAIFNESATDTLHSTTDIHAHNRMKLRLRSNGYMFHTSHASAFLKLQARRINESVRQSICAAKAKE